MRKKVLQALFSVKSILVGQNAEDLGLFQFNNLHLCVILS